MVGRDEVVERVGGCELQQSFPFGLEALAVGVVVDVHESCSHSVGCWGGGLGDPALVSVDGPVGLDVLDRLGRGVGDGVQGRALAGAAHGDVGEFASAAVGEHVGAVEGGALGAVHGGGVAVVEV